MQHHAEDPAERAADIANREWIAAWCRNGGKPAVMLGEIYEQILTELTTPETDNAD